MTQTTIWKWALPITIVFLSGLAIWAIQFNLDLQHHKSIETRIIEELMYFPSGKFLKPAVIEYQTAMADFVWLRAIQYYGQHLMTNQKYEWLGHIFDVLSTLDTRFIGAYHFGSLVLAWDAHQVFPAIKLLNQGMSFNPLNWQIVFDAAFINYMLTKDYVSAGYYFEIASKLPETWKITERWAAFSYAKGGANPMAIEIWASIYRTTENRKLKELAERELIKLGIQP
jgi:tetratricopeptide (TPR) repeat protein